MNEYKKCSKCGEEKPHSEFFKHPKTRDGLQSNCKECQKKKPTRKNEPKPHYVPATKVCSLCEVEKSADEFYHRWSAKDGLTSRCKACFGLNSVVRAEPLSPMKVCTKCKAEFPRTEEFFTKHPQTRDRLASWCRTCCGKLSKERSKTSQAKRKALKGTLPKEAYITSSTLRWIALFKSLSSCHYCGEDYPECLDFHHRDPTTKCFNISQATQTNSTIEQVKDEILKCDIVCSNCHRKIHAGRAPQRLKYRLNQDAAIRQRFDEVDGLLLQLKAEVNVKMREAA